MKKIIVAFFIMASISSIGVYCFQRYQQWRFMYPVIEEDYTIVWRDENLEMAIRKYTGLHKEEIKISDLWEYRYFDLGNEGIKSVEDIRDLKQLVFIDLSYNEISDISSLKGMELLDCLILDYNYVQDIEALDKLNSLRKLCLEGNQITDEQLKYLKGKDMRILNLSHNKLKHIDVLGEMSNLYQLVLDYNQISDITPLENLTNLSWLSLANNNIDKLIDFSGMQHLMYLNLGNNLFSDEDWEKIKFPENINVHNNKE